MKKIIISLIAAISVFAAVSKAVTINLGSTLEASDLFGLTPGSVANTELEIAAFINGKTGTTTFGQADILKDLGGVPTKDANNQFSVPAGYNWLVVQWDGPNGGAGLIQLNGNAALVPFYSYPLWGSNSAQYGVSHYGLAGGSDLERVPDGGSTALTLGFALMAIVWVRRRMS